MGSGAGTVLVQLWMIRGMFVFDPLPDAPLRPARHVIALWMRATGFRGLATPWAIYLRADSLADRKLIRHERMHVEQMRTDGIGRFLLRYAWWSYVHGYRMNPYEVEARAAEMREL
jgi:hypothetical protein